VVLLWPLPFWDFFKKCSTKPKHKFVSSCFYDKRAMGIGKSKQFTLQQNEIAHLAKALGHPARIAILQYLHEVNQCICGDLVDVLPLAQSTVSQHLRALKEAGLIQGNIEGASVCYCINYEKWENAREFFAQFFQQPGKCC
jgi:ArsR family transcriptional regulator